MVVKGYMQESFSPTISQVTLRIVVSFTSMPGFSSWDLDATSAVVWAVLPDDEVVYTDGIPGFPLPTGKGLRLLHTLYGLVQAPLAFYKFCKEVCTGVGYRQLQSDECVLFGMKSMSRKVRKLRKSCGP